MYFREYLLGNDSFVDGLNAPFSVHVAISPCDHHVAFVRVPHDVAVNGGVVGGIDLNQK